MDYSKWAVTPEEYPNKKYPPNCQGSRIIYSQGAINRLYRQAQITRYFWIDDVQISGIVCLICNISLQDWGPRKYILERMLTRLRKGEANVPGGYNSMFHLTDLEEDFNVLWKATRNYRTIKV